MNITDPWPWYVSGPVLGLFPALLLLLGNRMFGVSNNLRHICAAIIPGRTSYFLYDWKGEGGWNLAFAAGILTGGAVAATWLDGADAVAISDATRASLASLGVERFDGIAPRDVFNWQALLTWKGFVLIVGGGFLVGFGTAYAGGCTSGHGLSGIGDLQLPSVIALIGFFAGGIAGTFLLLPLLL